ncbi:MAG: prepilin-type N-terminal cleavage/methylation domain-containing protein [Planctomycetota bacterium]
MRQDKRSGFTLVELLIVVAIIATISAIAIPKLSGARLSANESSAMATLRTIATAEAQTLASSMIDSNGDGCGEYAYFAEMAGLKPARISAGGSPAAGIVGIDELRPSALISGMGNVNGGCVQRSGYYFQLWLPGATVGGAIPPIPEDPTGGKAGAPFPDAGSCSGVWCAYAWPVLAGRSGNSVFFMNQTGQMLQMFNRGAVKYTGLAGGPTGDAVFAVANDIGSGLGINGVASVDGNNWIPSKYSN